MQLLPANGKQAPVALTNFKQENVDRYTGIYESLNCITRKKYEKISSPKQGHLKNVKNLPRPLLRPGSIYACQQNSNPFRDPVPVKLMYEPGGESAWALMLVFSLGLSKQRARLCFILCEKHLVFGP